MTDRTDRRTFLTQQMPVFPASVFTAAWLQSLTEAQRVQWQALAAWQGAATSLNTSVWEAWAAHFAGGVPIDA
jgi:hypothetical protein